MESIEQSIFNSYYSGWLTEIISATGISSTNSEKEYAPLTCGDFQEENVAQYGGGTSIGPEVQFWSTKHSLDDNLNGNLGNYGQRSLDKNVQVGLNNYNSQTLDDVSKTAGNLVACLTYSPGIISHPENAERNGGSRSYDYVAVNTKDQVDGIPDTRAYVPKEWKNKTCEGDSNIISVDALQGSEEDIVHLKTLLPIQTERDHSCLNLSSADNLTPHLTETEFLTEDFHGIDVSSFISEEIENITPSINVEQNPLPVEVSYTSSPFPLSSRSHNGKKRNRLHEETNERESVNDALLYKKEKVKKIYEIDAPFEDTSIEKKRRDAIRAKRNRDKRKNDIKRLENQLNNLKTIRDSLMNEVSQLQEKEETLTKSLTKHNWRNDKTQKGEEKK